MSQYTWTVVQVGRNYKLARFQVPSTANSHVYCTRKYVKQEMQNMFSTTRTAGHFNLIDSLYFLLFAFYK